MHLTQQQLDDYSNKGWLVLKGFCDPQDLADFYRHFNSLLRLAAGRPLTGVESGRCELDLLLELAATQRDKLGAVYRSCRHLESLQKMLVNEKFMEVSRELMQTKFLNVCPYTATRIDIKGEEKYLFDWHQDYHYIQGSMDGVVYWIPLSELDTSGAVEVLEGSHRRGLQSVRIVDPHNENKNGAKTMELVFDPKVFSESGSIKPVLHPGDVLLFSTLLVHRSVPQSTSGVRVTTQFRYGNFLNADSVTRGWPVGQLEGRGFELDHPEYVTR